MNACENKCDKEYNPKNKDKLNYYVAQDLWGCKSACNKNKKKKSKSNSKSNKSRNSNASKSRKSNANKSRKKGKGKGKRTSKRGFLNFFKMF